MAAVSTRGRRARIVAVRHRWRFEHREYAWHEAPRERRHAFDTRHHARCTALADVVPFFDKANPRAQCPVGVGDRWAEKLDRGLLIDSSTRTEDQSEASTDDPFGSDGSLLATTWYRTGARPLPL